MFNLEQLIASGGILLVAAIVFAESGLLIGFFLPGDTLLLSAGVFAAQDKMPIAWLIVWIVIAAIVGDNVGYSIGRRTGHRIFKKEEGIFFHKKHIQRAEKFYEAHGGKTIIIARFVPIVRTFAPVVAGVGKMPRQRFFMFNIVGALIWGVGVTLVGYWFGTKIPNIDHYILPVITTVTALTFGPAIYHLLKEKSTREIIKDKVKLFFSNLLLNKRIR